MPEINKNNNSNIERNPAKNYENSILDSNSEAGNSKTEAQRSTAPLGEEVNISGSSLKDLPEISLPNAIASGEAIAQAAEEQVIARANEDAEINLIKSAGFKDSDEASSVLEAAINSQEQ